MKALFLVSLAAGLWGTVGVASRLMSGQPRLDPALAGLARTALGGLFLLAIAAAIGLPRPIWRRLPLAPFFIFAIAGAVFQVCLFAAYDAVGVTVTVVVTVAGPATVVALGDALWNRRLPEAAAAAAIALAVAGVVLALLGGNRPAGPLLVAWGGIALLVAAVTAFAIVAFAARTLGGAMHPLHGVGLALVATAAALAAATLARRGVDLRTLAAMPTRDLAILGYTGVIATGGAYLAFTLGMRLSRSPTVGIAPTLIEPGVAALLAALVLQEQLGAREAVGCGLMLAAMVILAMSEWRGLARRDSDLLERRP